MVCQKCNTHLKREFVPTRSKPVVFANSSTYYGTPITGPKQMQRYLRERGLTHIEDASPHEVARHNRRLAEDREAQMDKEIEDAVHEAAEEVREGLVTSNPDRMNGPKADPLDGVAEDAPADLEEWAGT